MLLFGGKWIKYLEWLRQSSAFFGFTRGFIMCLIISYVKSKGNFNEICYYWLWILKDRGTKYYLPLRIQRKDCLFVWLVELSYFLFIFLIAEISLCCLGWFLTHCLKWSPASAFQNAGITGLSQFTPAYFLFLILPTRDILV